MTLSRKCFMKMMSHEGKFPSNISPPSNSTPSGAVTEDTTSGRSKHRHLISGYFEAIIDIILP